MSNSRMAGQSLGLVPEDLADVGENMTYNPAMASGGKDMGNVASVFYNVDSGKVTGKDDGDNSFHAIGGKFGRKGVKVNSRDLEQIYGAGSQWATGPVSGAYAGNNAPIKAVRNPEPYQKFGKIVAREAEHNGYHWEHGRNTTKQREARYARPQPQRQQQQYRPAPQRQQQSRPAPQPQRQQQRSYDGFGG